MAADALFLAAGVIWFAKEMATALTLKTASFKGREATIYFRVGSWFSAGMGAVIAISAAFRLGAGL